MLITTFVADTPPGRDVDFGISTDSVNNNPITDATITITSLIQDHINRHTQNLIANPQDQRNPPDIQTDNPQDNLNQPVIQTKNLEDLVNQTYIETDIPQIPLNIPIAEEQNLMQTNINQEQNLIQINIAQEQSEIQPEQNNQINKQSKIKS